MKELPSDYISQSSAEYTIDRRRFLKCVVLVLAGSAAIWSINGGILTSTVSGQSVNIRSAALDDLYTRLKDLEGQIPIPEPTARVKVGLLDAARGVFNWRVPVKREITVIPGKGKVITLIGTPSVRAVNVDLVFGVQNRQEDFEVTVDGTTVNAPAGQFEITIPVRRASDMLFTVKSGSVSFNAELIISRYAAGAGAFTIDALPIAIVYCPLQGQRRQNQVAYQRIEWVGTTMAFTYATEDSDITIEGDDLAGLGDAAGKIGDILTDYEATKPAGTVLKGISTVIAGLGSDVVREGTVTETSSKHEVENKTLTGTRLVTPPGASPGEGGEIYVLLQNVQAAWLASNGDLSIAIFHTPELALYPTVDLQADLADLEGRRAPPEERGSRTRLMALTLRDLLKLNPFWTPPNVRAHPPSLLAPRFRQPDQLATTDYRGPTDAMAKFVTVVNDADTRVEATTYTHVHDVRSGFLSFLGLGPSEDKTVTLKTTVRNLSRRTSGLSVETDQTVKLEAGEGLRITAYYDRLFGTSAFVSPDQVGPP